MWRGACIRINADIAVAITPSKGAIRNRPAVVIQQQERAIRVEATRIAEQKGRLS
jgi:hypothetical protein